MLSWFSMISTIQSKLSKYKVRSRTFLNVSKIIHDRGKADVFSSPLSLLWCSSKGQTHHPEILISHSRHEPPRQGLGSQIEKRQCHFSPWQKNTLHPASITPGTAPSRRYRHRSVKSKTNLRLRSQGESEELNLMGSPEPPAFLQLFLVISPYKFVQQTM